MHTRLKGYLTRFTLTHVGTYLVCGLIAFYLAGYTEPFQSPEMSGLMRPTDSPIVRAAVLFQFFRGALLGLFIYPFYDTMIKSKLGWLKLFGLLWGLTLIGAVNAGGGSIEGLIYTTMSLQAHLIGIPEVTIQMLAFAWLFVRWEQKAIGQGRASLAS